MKKRKLTFEEKQKQVKKLLRVIKEKTNDPNTCDELEGLVRKVLKKGRKSK